ncbi:sensor histidine kinase [Ideonella sp. 4Y16]|uniref:sensor histidine kinase n=1 Tax=Ideonella alba TaxID=2824118 RepID=UPI001B36E33B|nr:ATP-binding protein [Ideonella alba]MBQ0944739.1 sensor histidine kinase [Ideonella alba]
MPGLSDLPPPSATRWLRPLVWALLLAAPMGLGSLLAFNLNERAGLAQLVAVSNERLELYAATLDAELRRCAFVPGLVAGDADVRALLAAPQDEDLRRRAASTLARIGVRSGASLVVVADAAGRPLASSHGASAPLPATALRALQDEASDYFVANPLDGSTDFVYLLPVAPGGEALGRVLVVLNLAPLEATWIDLGLRSQSERLLVVDERQVAVLSSVPAWKYRRMDDAEVADPARYPGAALASLRLPVQRLLDAGATLVRAPDPADPQRETPFVAQERPIVPLAARLLALSDPSDVWRQARQAAWAGAAVGALLGGLVLYLLQRRRAMRQLLQARNALQSAHDQLEQQVDERTAELLSANDELKRQIAQRELAEDELMQAGKMAVLGQMSAGISHEINQPLTALRALSRNALRLLEGGRQQAVADNLRSIDEMAERMGRIVNQLKSFARKDSLHAQPVPLERAARNVLLMLEHRLHHEPVTVDLDVPEDLQLRADATRLEQVLLNLCGNALDALAGRPQARMTVLGRPLGPLGERVLVQVIDNGPGVDEAAMARLFEPFHTTKPAGEGLGLGLVISSKIVGEMGGSLRAHRGAAGGMVFEFDLPGTEDSHV